MKIKMLKYVNGKVNGIHMGPYLDGGEYDIDRERAELFIGSAMAEEVVPSVEPVEPVEPDKPEHARRRR